MAAPQSRDPSTHLGAFLGQQLRQARSRAGYRSQEALADVLGTERTVVGKGETGEYPPAEPVLSHWLDTCNVTGDLRDTLEGIGRIARMRANPEQSRVAPWYETEARAHTLRYWAPILVPGPVQTEAYATELIKSMRYDQVKTSEYLDIRMRRQEFLTRSAPPDVTIVLWEPILHHQIGTRETMRDQIARLIDVSDLPTVMLQILRASHGANPGLGGAIQLAATDQSPELLLSDSMVDDQLTTDPVTVRKARTTFNSVRADSLSRTDSRNLLLEALRTWTD